MQNRDELESRILREIRQTGFPLELRVSQLFSNRGCYVANNLYFLDKDEEKGREFDLRVLKNYEFEKEGTGYRVRHCLLIECKKSEDKPWVFFSSPITSYDPGLPRIPCRGVKRGKEWFMSLQLRELKRRHPFASYARRGRSYFEPFRKTKESSKIIFGALTTVAKATIFMRDTEFAAGHSNICFYYPLIVFDGNLFEAGLHGKDVRISPVDSLLVTFFYRSSKYEDESFCIPVLTEGALRQFVDRLDEVLIYCGTSFGEELHIFQE